MKRKIISFFIYAVIVIIVLAVVIILRANSNNNSNKSSKQTSTQTLSSTDEKIKTTLTLNVPNNITMSVGDKIELLYGYITIEPESEKENLTYSISGKYSSSNYGISFANNTISAIIAGNYSLTFSVNSEISASISIRVDQNNAKVNQKITNITRNELYNLDDLFEFDNTVQNFRLDTSGFSTNNGKVFVNKTGNCLVDVFLTDGFVCYKYNFTFNVKEAPEYSISLVDATPRDKISIADNNLTITFVEDLMVSLYYKVVDKNNEVATQEVAITIDNPEILEKVSVADGRIRLNVLDRGSCQLKIYLIETPEVYININVLIN